MCRVQDLSDDAAGAGDLRYLGPVVYDQNGDIPVNGASGDVPLPWMFGSIWDTSTGTGYITDTDSNGHYDASGGSGTWWIGFAAKETSAGGGRVTRVDGNNGCNSAVLRDMYGFIPGDSDTRILSDGVQRFAGLGYYWLNYGISAYENETLGFRCWSNIRRELAVQARNATIAGTMFSRLIAAATFSLIGMNTTNGPMSWAMQ